MERTIDVVRLGLVLGAVVMLAASARPQPPPPQTAGPGQPAADPQYSPCEHACGQVARCELAPYEACLFECRRHDAEAQPGGPEQLHTISQTGCEELAQQYDDFSSPPDVEPAGPIEPSEPAEPPPAVTPP